MFFGDNVKRSKVVPIGVYGKLEIWGKMGYHGVNDKISAVVG